MSDLEGNPCDSDNTVQTADLVPLSTNVQLLSTPIYA